MNFDPAGIIRLREPHVTGQVIEEEAGRIFNYTGELKGGPSQATANVRNKICVNGTVDLKATISQDAPNHPPNLSVASVVPFGWHLPNSILHTRDMLPELEHLLPWYKFSQTNNRDRRELRAFQSPLLRHVHQVRDIERAPRLNVKDKLLQLGTKKAVCGVFVWIQGEDEG
jgi:hypothetical protein